VPHQGAVMTALFIIIVLGITTGLRIYFGRMRQ
jgi:hypothetical protein